MTPRDRATKAAVNADHEHEYPHGNPYGEEDDREGSRHRWPRSMSHRLAWDSSTYGTNFSHAGGIPRRARSL